MLETSSDRYFGHVKYIFTSSNSLKEKNAGDKSHVSTQLEDHYLCVQRNGCCRVC